MEGPRARTAEETAAAPLTDRAPASRLAGDMIQPSESLGRPVAPPNQHYASPPDDVPGLALRWLLRLAGQMRRQYLCRLRPGFVARAGQSTQYAGSLFEQALLVMLDAVSVEIGRRLGTRQQELDSRHANLE